jgi:hypothetical protein
MAAHAVFNFSARFLSSGPPSSQSGRKSKLLTRRAASRMPIQCVQTGESLFSHEIISVAPAIADIDVVASLPEVAPVPEATATVPAIVLVTASEVEPNDADQNAVIPFPAKVMNSGTEPENDHILRVKNAAPEIVLATEITVTVQTIANVEPVPAIPPVDESSEMPLTIAINTPADTTLADMIPPATMKDRKRGKQKGTFVLCSPRKKKSSSKVSGKERSPVHRDLTVEGV